jgi:hypothetical protein
MPKEADLQKMNMSQIKAHIREFNDHYAIRGYSKLNKSQLISAVLTAQKRVASAGDPALPVKFPTAKKGGGTKKAPAKKAPAKKATPKPPTPKPPTPKPPTPTPATISGRNILYKSEFYTKEEWKKRRKEEKLRAGDFVKGTINEGAARMLNTGEQDSLYFRNPLQPVILQHNDTTFELFDPIKDKDSDRLAIKRAYEKGRITVVKLTDKQIKEAIKEKKGNMEEREAMMFYLNAPEILKKKHKEFGVYKGEDNPRNPNDTKMIWYGILYPDVILYPKKYIYKFAKAGKFVRDMIKTSFVG